MCASIRLLINLSEGLMDSCRDERLAGICQKKKGGVGEIADEISQRKIGYARRGFPTRSFTSLVSRKDLDKKVQAEHKWLSPEESFIARS